MRQRQTTRPLNRASPFIELETEMFQNGLACRVVEAVRLLDRGRVKFKGIRYPARLYEPNCATTLLPDQEALAIGRKGNTLIIMPLHCILWPQYLEMQGPWLTNVEIELMERYECSWRY